MDRRAKKRRPGAMARWGARIRRAACWYGSRVEAGWRAACMRLRPWQPVVIVDAKRSRARRLRRMVVRTTRAQFKALGVAPPKHLLLVVQRVVQNERPVASLLQVFDGRDGMRRHVLYLAFVVEEESMSDGEIVATLRQQLYEVVGDALGPLVRAVPATSAPSRPASVVPFRSPAPEPPPFEDDDAPPLDDSWVPTDGGAVAAAAER